MLIRYGSGVNVQVLLKGETTMDAKKRHFMAVLLVLGLTLVGLTMLNGCKKEEPLSEATDTSHEGHDHGPGEHTHAHVDTAMTTETAKEIAGAEQTTCPVMEGNPINKQYFVEYKGKKVYFCCPGCDKKFTANPEQYLAKLPQFEE